MEDETMRASFSDRFYIAAPQGVAVKLSAEELMLLNCADGEDS